MNLPKIIFLRDAKICTGIFCYTIKAGTVAQCLKMYAKDAAEVVCKNSHGETVSFVETFIGSPIMPATRFYDETAPVGDLGQAIYGFSK